MYQCPAIASSYVTESSNQILTTHRAFHQNELELREASLCMTDRIGTEQLDEENTQHTIMADESHSGRQSLYDFLIKPSRYSDTGKSTVDDLNSVQLAASAFVQELGSCTGCRSN